MQFSPRLINIFAQIVKKSDNPDIAELVEALRANVAGVISINFIDYEVVDDAIFLSFLPSNRTLQANANEWNNKSRQKGKVGRVIKKLYPNVNDGTLEKFVVIFNSILLEYKADIRIVTGQELAEYYNEAFHHRTAGKDSMLSKSCMRYDHCEPFFDIYKDNPDKVSMAVSLIDKEVVARALIWQAVDAKTKTPISVMDRIYYATPLDQNFMLKWGMENCDLRRIIGPGETGKTAPETCLTKLGTIEKFKMYVEIENWRHRKYPYLDTFFYLDKVKNQFQNFEVNHRNYRKFLNQDGKFYDNTGDYAPPVSPGHIWIDRLKKEFPIELTTTINDMPFLLTEVGTCGICELTQIRIKMVPFLDDKYICANHLDHTGIVTVGMVKYRRCGGCNKFTQTTEKYCTECIKKSTECHLCNIRLFHDFDKFSVVAGDICPSCYFRNYDHCNNCGSLADKQLLGLTGDCC